MTLLPVFKKTVFRFCTDYLYLPRKIAVFLKDFEGTDFTILNPRGYTWEVKVEFFGFENTEGIPKAFWNEHIVPSGRSNETKATILGSSNRRWVVDIIDHADGRHFLSNGCKDMIQELELPINAYGQMRLQNVSRIVLAFWI